MINLNPCVEYFIECDRCENEYYHSLYSIEGYTEERARAEWEASGWLLDKDGKGKAVCPTCAKKEKQRMACTNCGSEFWGEHILHDEIKDSGICPVCRQSENLVEAIPKIYKK